MRLPAFTDYESFRPWRSDVAQCLPAALDIARSHGLPCDQPHPFATGTNLVVGLDDRHILKLFPPPLRAQFVSERAALAVLRGKLGIAIPEIVVEGERDGWPYLVITRLSGVLGSEAWPSLSEAQKERVLSQIGAIIADVQRVPPGALAELEPRWDVFMQRQFAACRARHERQGLPQKFLDGFDELLRDAAVLIPMDRPAVILTGEYIPENFLLDRRGDDWHVAGLIDFGDVQTGWCEYDLLGPSVFMASAIPRRVRCLFEGFGYARGKLDYELKRRLMALIFLHRASNPVRQFCIPDWQNRAADLVQLQELIWQTE